MHDSVAQKHNPYYKRSNNFYLQRTRFSRHCQCACFRHKWREIKISFFSLLKYVSLLYNHTRRFFISPSTERLTTGYTTDTYSAENSSYCGRPSDAKKRWRRVLRSTKPPELKLFWSNQSNSRRHDMWLIFVPKSHRHCIQHGGQNKIRKFNILSWTICNFWELCLFR